MVSRSFIGSSDPKLYQLVGRTNCFYYSTGVDLYSHQILLNGWPKCHTNNGSLPISLKVTLLALEQSWRSWVNSTSTKPQKTLHSSSCVHDLGTHCILQPPWELRQYSHFAWIPVLIQSPRISLLHICSFSWPLILILNGPRQFGDLIT